MRPEWIQSHCVSGVQHGYHKWRWACHKCNEWLGYSDSLADFDWQAHMPDCTLRALAGEGEPRWRYFVELKKEG